MKDEDVMNQIEKMLENIKEVDKSQHQIILSLLNEVFKEYNSGVKRKIDQKLWDMVDAEIKLKARKV